ncbi:MAG: hypothetical protein MMC33_007520 [Icmadophila ericetorum]|nr:hypothetical protein [Icmadophila ericetorum]
MPKIFCCTSRRQLSPDIPNIRYVESPRDGTQDLQIQAPVPSPHVLGSAQNDETDPEIRKLFALSDQADDDHGSCTSLEHPGSRRASKAKHKKSSSRLSIALRKRFSRDSAFSDRSSPVKRSLSEEEVERRKELKRALHQRVRNELLEGGAAGEGDYDTDAELIITPFMTKVRSEGAIKISPQQLSDVFRRADSSKSLDILDQKLEAAVQPSPPARTSSNAKHHTNDSPSSKSEHWEDAHQHLPIEPAATKEDVLDPEGMVYVTNLELELPTRHFETKLTAGPIEIPLSPDLLPLRLPSISESIQRGWHLSYSSSHQDVLVPEVTDGPEDKESKRGSVSRSLPPEWLHGASGVLLPFGSRSSRANMRDEGTHLDRVQENEGDPTIVEESILGNIDGAGSYSCKRRTLGHETTLAGDELLAVRRQRQSAKNYPTEEDCSKYQHQASSSGLEDLSGYRPWRPMQIDNGSSVYASQAASPSSTSLGSVTRLPKGLNKKIHIRSTSPANSQSHSITDLSKFEKGPLETLEVDLMKRCPTDTSSFRSSTDSFRAKELVAAESRIIIPKPRAYSSPKISRFAEELDEETSVIPRRASAYPTIGRYPRSSSSGHDGSDEWYIDGKRHGYGYSFVPPRSNSLAQSWESALQSYADEASPGLRKDKLEGEVDQSRLMVPSGSRRNFSTSSTASEDPLSGYEVTVYSQGKCPESTSDTDAASLSRRTQEQRLISYRTPPASWSRYPSHLRSARGAAAGAADKVVVRDFSEEGDAKAELHKDVKDQNSHLGKTKSRSMTFGKSVFKKMGRLYASKSATFRSFEYGHRSSISAGGKLEYPELEILPPMFATDKLRQIPSEESPSLADSFPSQVESIDPMPHHVFPKIAANNERDAKAWSQLYADCVAPYPRETEELGDSEELRGSTLAFQVALEDDARKAREDALRAAKQSWSTEGYGSPMGGLSPT